MAGDSVLSTFDSAFCLGHPQAWRLEEHVFDRKSPGTEVTVHRAGSRAPTNVICSGPITAGSAISAHLPEDLNLERVRDGRLATTEQHSAFYR